MSYVNKTYLSTQFTNFANRITSVFAKLTDLPTKTSELDNDSGFITSSALPTVNDGTLTIQINGTDVGTFNANQSTDGTINIIVPTNTSDLTNDSGYITEAVIYWNKSYN